MKILLLEDDSLLNETITKYLRMVGHTIVSAKDGKECLGFALEEKFDLSIFDINVPFLDGLSLLEDLHVKKRAMPVIYISALNDIEEISKAYELGCSDYIKKPFHLKELDYRINKVSQTLKQDMHHKRLSKSYSFDCDNMILYYNNTPQTLSKRQLQIVDFLAHNRSFVCTYEMFKEYVWFGEEIEEGTIRAEINRLKKNLKEDFIENIRGIGYKISTPT